MWLLFILFGLLGISAEIIFTSIKHQIKHSDYSFIGFSNLYMLIPYGLAPILFPHVFYYIQHLFILIRIIVYGVIILSIEYIAGFIIDFFTGKFN